LIIDYLVIDYLIDMNQIKSLLISITKEAGLIALANFKKFSETEIEYKKQGEKSPVTFVDKELDNLIRKRVLDAFPNHDIISEENETVNNAGEVVWIIDPIDGTGQYIKNSQNYCVTIGVAINGQSVMGTVYAPSQDKFYFAEKGGGVYLNEVKQEFNCPKTGLCYVGKAAHGDEAASHQITKMMKQGRLGSAALEVVGVAFGQVDAAYYRDINIWDISAATLIANEAGCKTVDFEGNEHVLGNPNLIVYRAK